MQSWDSLPRRSLDPAGAVGAQFLALGLADYRAAARYVGVLPYGRTSDRADFSRVLPEGRGTCSTKHALLATLAAERRLPVYLALGIYEMTEANTPGVGEVLDAYHLRCIPEAHCYLTYSGRRIDVTRISASPAEPIARFLHEEPISPDQIGAYKVAVHQRYLRQWAANLAPALSWEQVWKIREDCIAAIEQAG